MFNYVKQINSFFLIKQASLIKNELNFLINTDNAYRFIKFLKKNEFSRFDLLVDICGVDYLKKKNRFEVVYNLLSMQYTRRVRVKVYLNTLFELNSIESLFPAASWYERELWDLFGIFIQNHSDLRRILTDYGFDGFPLRKDFPLTGFFEVRYDYYKKLIILNNLELSQQFKHYNYLSPWV